MKRILAVAAALAACGAVAPAASAATTNAGNGTVQVGLTDLGVLGAQPCDVNVGVRLAALGQAGDGVCHGRDTFDGWGAADATSGVTGYVKSPDLVAPVNVTAQAPASGSGTTVTAVDRIGTTLRVTHAFAPSPATPNVYVALVTVKNISAAPVDVRYRRTTDWDDPAFKEHAVLGGTLPASLSGGIVDENAGLPIEALNPLGPGQDIGQPLPGPLADFGPHDSGLRLDVALGSVPPDACQAFQLYFGAAPDAASANAAVSAAGIVNWALFTPDADPVTGTPVTYITGYAPPSSGPFPCPDPAPATPPAAAPAPPASAAPAQTPLKAAGVFVLPSAKACVSRRSFRIRLRVPKGVTAASATVLVNGRTASVVKGRRLTAPIDLRGLPKGRFTVKITLKTTDGRSVSSARHYRTCAPKPHHR